MLVELQDDMWSRLHDVRLRGLVQGADDLVTEQLISAGYLVRRGRGVAVTPAGKEANAAWARVPDTSAEHAVVRAAYDRFLAIDRSVKQVTMDWQLESAKSSPAGYSVEDWKIIDRLTALDEKAGGLLLQLGRAVPRFAGYRPRLRNALQQLEEGDRKWFSGLTCDSYHTVWWQLHEDLLIALGIARSDDPNQ